MGALCRPAQPRFRRPEIREPCLCAARRRVRSHGRRHDPECHEGRRRRRGDPGPEVIWVLLKLFGISSATTLAFICLILSIIQIGPGLVLLPVVIYAWSSMSGGAALGLSRSSPFPPRSWTASCAPSSSRRACNTPMLVILIGVLGGMMAYGLIGVFMGPVLFAVLLRVVQPLDRMKAPRRPRMTLPRRRRRQRERRDEAHDLDDGGDPRPVPQSGTSPL